MKTNVHVYKVLLSGGKVIYAYSTKDSYGHQRTSDTLEELVLYLVDFFNGRLANIKRKTIDFGPFHDIVVDGKNVDRCFDLDDSERTDFCVLLTRMCSKDYDES